MGLDSPHHCSRIPPRSQAYNLNSEEIPAQSRLIIKTIMEYTEAAADFTQDRTEMDYALWPSQASNAHTSQEKENHEIRKNLNHFASNIKPEYTVKM